MATIASDDNRSQGYTPARFARKKRKPDPQPCRSCAKKTAALDHDGQPLCRKCASLPVTSGVYPNGVRWEIPSLLELTEQQAADGGRGSGKGGGAL